MSEFVSPTKRSAGRVVRDIIGVVVGTYSSVFVASPILLLMDSWLKAREEARALRAKMSGEVVTEDA